MVIVKRTTTTKILSDFTGGKGKNCPGSLLPAQRVRWGRGVVMLTFFPTAFQFFCVHTFTDIVLNGNEDYTSHMMHVFSYFALVQKLLLEVINTIQCTDDVLWNCTVV